MIFRSRKLFLYRLGKFASAIWNFANGELLLMKKLFSAFALFAIPLSIAWASQTGTRQPQPVRLHPQNPQYFLFRGKAVAFVTSGEHYGAVLNADVDYQRYLDTIKAAGLNYTRIFGGSYVEVPGKSFGILRNDLAPAPGRYVAPWARSSTPGYAGGGNKFDLSQWDREYFRRFHDFLTLASDRGIVVEITLFSAHYGDPQWNLSTLNPANNVNGTDAVDYHKLHTLDNGNILAIQERYVRKLVHEANAFDNIIYEIQNEPWSDRTAPTDVIGPVNPFLQAGARDRFPNAAQLADDDSIAWQAKVAEWIASEEASLPNKHLIAQGYSNFRYPVRTLVPGVSVVNFHYAYPEAASWNYGLGKAIAYDETGFMGRDDDSYRRQAWNFMMSGGGIFDALDYSFSPGHEDGLDTEANGPGGGSAALRQQLHVLSDFLQSFSLVNLHPDALAVVAAPGTIPRVLSSPGQEYAIYFDGVGPVEVTLNLPAGEYSGAWVDTVTGSAAQPEHFRHAGGNKVLESPNFKNGIALTLKKTGR